MAQTFPLQRAAESVSRLSQKLIQGSTEDLEDNQLRRQFKNDLETLVDALTAPYEILERAFLQVFELAALRYVHRFRVAHHLPVSESVSFAELAAKCGVDASQLQQMLRVLAPHRIFRLLDSDHVAHTRASLLLLDPLAGSWNEYVVEDVLPVIPHHILALDTWGHGSLEPGQTAFNHAHGTDLRYFEFHERHAPVQRQRFTRAMQYLNQSPGMSVQHLVHGYPWAENGRTTMVDVGGDVGHTSIAIARAFPGISCIVQDLPETIRRGLKELPPELHSRITFMAHDFFHQQPVEADVYLLRLILHDWQDEPAIQILRNIAAVMKQGSRILIMDQCLLGPADMLSADEKFCTSMNCAMQVLLNATERTELDWRRLITRADCRLQIGMVLRPRGSLMSIIEVLYIVD